MGEMNNLGKRLPFSRSLEGLRGYCVLAVMLSHWELMREGWIGVQIFFVLSGFLITDSLLSLKSEFTGLKAFAVFYYRRSLRIFPAYLALVGLFTILIIAIGKPKGFDRVMFSAWTYTLNIYESFPGFPSSRAFSHLWSLSVEEQFYLFWPLVIFRFSQQTVWRMVVTAIIAGPVLRFGTAALFDALGVSPEQRGFAVYMLTPSHIDAFACGAAIALGMPFFADGSGEKAMLFGLLALAFGLFYGYPVRMTQPIQILFSYTVLNIGAAMLIAYLRHPGRTMDFFFTSLPIRAVGRVSYCMYLIHSPLMNIFDPPRRNQWELWSVARFLLWAVTCFAVSWASFRYFESKFLDRKDRLPGCIQKLNGAMSKDMRNPSA